MPHLLSFLAGLPSRGAAKRDERVPSIFAIVPTAISDASMLRRCIEAAQRSSVGTSLRIILVLCPGTPEKADALKRIAGADAECLVLDGPFSFARSNNEALKLLRDEEYILLLNDDCFLQDAYDLKRLVRSMDEHGLAAISPWVDHQEFAWELPRERRTLGLKRTRFPIIGACMLWSRTWLDRIGRFDESFDGYGMEEADLLLRGLKLGGRWMRDDRVWADHLHHATFGADVKETELHERNLQRWAEKWPGTDSWGMSDEWKANLKP